MEFRRKRWVPRFEMALDDYIRANANGDIKQNIMGEDLIWTEVTEAEYREKWNKYHRDQFNVDKVEGLRAWKKLPISKALTDKP